MKKTTLLIATALMATTTLAQQPLQRATSLAGDELRIMQTRADDDETLIFNPEGRHVKYVKSAYYLYSFYGIQMDGLIQNLSSEVVFGDDDTVYIKDPFTGFEMAGYIKGTRTGNEITFNFPQLIYSQEKDGQEYFYYINWLEKYSYTGDDGRNYMSYRVVPQEDNKLVMTIDDKGVISMDESGRTDSTFPTNIYGLCDADGNWTKFGDCEVVLTPFEPEVATPPASVDVENWALVSISGSRFVKVAIDGNDFYVGHLYKDFPDTYMKGTLRADGKVVFPKSQYLGVYQSLYCYMMPCSQYTYTNEDGLLVVSYRMLPELVMTWDAEKKSLSCEDSFCVSTTDDRISYVAMYDQPEIHWQNPDIKPAAPATPVVGLHYDYSTATNCGAFYTQIPTFDVNGNLLDADKMFYNVYVDGELFTFQQDEYTGLPFDEITDIPYDFTDNNDIFVNGTRHIIIFYFRGVENIGVVSCYNAGEEGVLRSEMGLYSFSGIADMEAETLTEQWFDLQGRRVANPANGLYIKRELKADGSVATGKVMLK